MRLKASPKKPAAVLNRAADWFTPGRFAAMLGLLIAMCFAPVLAGFETFYAVDFGTFGYPIASWHRDCFWAGELPLWNPYNNCGMPFLAQWNTMTLYPLSLFYLLFPLSWSLGVFCVGHLFMAGMGMYFLARRWTGNNLAAALGGAAFAFNGLAWFGLMWPNNIAALAWMPWVVLAMEKAWEAKHETAAREIVLAALAGATQMLSGAPEVIAQTWMFLGALWLVRFFCGGLARGKMFWRMAAICTLVAGLTAAQMWPFLDLLSHSQRSTQFDTSAMLAMPAYGWANYLVPLFHCFHSPQGVLIQPGQGWVGSYYAGVPIVALALLAVWRARNHRMWLLAGVIVFSLTMALGNHFFAYPFFKRVLPLIGLMRFPVKFVALATFAFPLLAAFGLGRLLSATANDWADEWKKVRGIAIGLAVAIAVILLFAWERPLGSDDVPATLLNGVMRIVFLALALGCIVLLRRETEQKRFIFCQIGLILLLWFDVFTHAPNLSPTVARSVYEPDAIRTFFKWNDELRPGVSRALPTTSSVLKMLTQSSGNPETDVTGKRLSLLDNFNLLDHAAKVDGFYSLDLKEFNDVVRLLNYLTNDTANLRDFLMVSRVSNPTNAVDWVARSSTLPMIMAGQKPVFVAHDDEIKALVDKRFDARTTVCLPEDLRGEVQADATTAKVVEPQISARQLQFIVEASAPAMVTISQAYYHPWHAYVDEKPVSLWRANHAFQALEVPAGKHAVKLAYEDKVFWSGVICSFGSLAVCAGIWIFYRRDAETQRRSK